MGFFEGKSRRPSTSELKKLDRRKDAETISHTKVDMILEDDAVLSSDRTVAAGPDYPPRDSYRGGKIVSVPEGTFLSAKFVYTWREGSQIQEIEGPEFDLAELLNSPSDNPVYAPWRRFVPKSKGILIAGRTQSGQFSNPKEAWDLMWMRSQRERRGLKGAPISGIRPETENNPQTFQFMLYVKEAADGSRTLFLYDENSSNGNSVTFPVASTKHSTIASLANAFEQKSPVLGDSSWRARASAFRETFLRTQSPQREVFSLDDIAAALPDAERFAKASGEHFMNVYRAAFVLNYFIIGDRVDIGIHDGMDTDSFKDCDFDRYSQYLKRAYAMTGEATVHTIVNSTLWDHDALFHPRPKDAAGNRIEVPGFRIKHIPLMALDDIDHYRRIGCGGFVDGTNNREYEFQIVLEYIPGML